MRAWALILAFSWAEWWWTPDQQGKRLFERGDAAAAAEAFEDPMWKGAAYYEAKDFEEAARMFGRRDTADAHFNRGNALVMLGKYDDAIRSYEDALAIRPEWTEARENRDLAKARAERLEAPGGDMGDQTLGADEIVFDKENDDGQDTVVAGEEAATDATVQAMWLRRVQTRPADFLKAKFAYQHRMESDEGQ